MQGNQGGRGVPPTMAMRAAPAESSDTTANDGPTIAFPAVPFPAVPSPAVPAQAVPAPAHAVQTSARRPASRSAAGVVVAAVVGIGCLGVTAVGTVVLGAAFVVARSSSAPIEHEPVYAAPPTIAAGGPTVGVTDPFASERMAVPIPIGAPSRGPLDAPITIVEAGDFQCPFCARATSTVARVLADHPDDVRVVWIDHPLEFHTSARMAARAAREAQAEGGDARFWMFHDLLFANVRTLDRESILAMGAQAGLDPVRLAAAVDGTAYDTRIDADVMLAERFGARGTPGFFVNGRRVMGAQPYETFARMIDEELAYTRRLEASGVGRARLYAALTERASPTAIPEPSVPSAAPPAERDDPTRVHRVPVGTSPQQGPADALVTVVVFSDFQCPFCARLAPTLARVRATYGDDVRIVFKHNPLPFHDRAAPAAIAASEVYASGGASAFFRMHDLLFENQRALADDDLARYAEAAGASGSRVRQALARSAHQADIEADQALARSIGADGTPTSFVNGRQLRGAQPYDAFARLIDEELTTARAMIAAGTPRDRVYDVIQAGAR